MRIRTATSAVLVAMLLATGVIAPAAADHVPDHETYPSTPEANNEQWWQNTYGPDVKGEDDWECTKDDTGANAPYVLGSPSDGHVWRLLVVKAGADHNDLYWNPVVGQSYAATGQGAGGWSHVILCQRPAPEPDPLSLTVVKAWDGDGEGDAIATILVDGTELTDPVEVEDGDAVTITETVTGLPDDCTYTSDPATPYEYTVDPDDAVDGLITLTLTNTVDCDPPGEEPPGEEPPGEEPTDVLGVVIEDDDDTQVLGVQQTATSRQLPRTGAGVLALLAFGLGAMSLGGALLRRR